MNGAGTLHYHDVAFAGVSRRQDGVFFVQIGAADGRRFDPIHPFVSRYGWRGILVEPLGDIFRELVRNYANQDGLVFENVAIAESDGERQITRVPMQDVGADGVPEWAYGASTLTPEKTRFCEDNSPPELHAALSSAMVEETVDCLSLSSLLDRHVVDTIDVLQIDTEGYDAKIIAQLDFERFRPSVINMEWQWLQAEERRNVSELLSVHGYKQYSVGPDLLATQGQIEKFLLAPAIPDPGDVPLLFPGITGIIALHPVSEDGRLAEGGGSQFQIARYRGNALTVSGRDELYRLLTGVDGSRSFRELADLIGLPLNETLLLARELRSQYVLE